MENVGEDDAGEYICRATNQAGEKQEKIQIDGKWSVSTAKCL